MTTNGPVILNTRAYKSKCIQPQGTASIMKVSSKDLVSSNETKRNGTAKRTKIQKKFESTFAGSPY